MKNTTTTLVAALIAAGVSPTDAAAAAAAAMGANDAPAAAAPKPSAPKWRDAVATAAEGFTNEKGKRVDTCIPGTVRIHEGDEQSGMVYGRDAKDAENVRLRVSTYRRTKGGEYRVRTIATATHGDLALWSTLIDALGTAPAPAPKNAPKMSKRDMLRAAKAAGVKIDGRKSEENVRAEFVAAGLA